ncbi:MAG: GIY-YIG nuclease family protein [Pseudomonadota bacterium]
MATWQVYILECSDGSLYTGISNDLERRLATHNEGKGAKYTRSRLPVRLVYAEHCEGKSAALRREIAIKRLSSSLKHELCQKYSTEGNHG